MEKFLENISKAEKTLKTTDHIIYITFPMIKDKRLLLKALQEIKNSTVLCKNSILQYDYMYKKITLYKNKNQYSLLL